MTTIIGFMGKAGAGKTTAAQAVEKFVVGSVIKSFSTPLKNAVRDLFLFSDEQVFGSYEHKVAVDPRWGVSPREVLQKVGTECLRDMICEGFHVKRMEAEIDGQHEDNVVIIDDVRFVDEAQMVLDRGGILISIRRPPEEISTHASERPPYALATHEIVNVGSLIKFETDVRLALYEELKRREHANNRTVS